MKAPLISVALPVYNAEKYLAEAIDSILAQTFTDFELIIIDDGSSDKSLEIIKKYQLRDSRIITVARENQKLVATLNEIIDLARGKWLARMDQDDIALPSRFERQLEWLEKTDADICGGWIRLFGGDSNQVVKHGQTAEAIKMELLFGTPFAHPTVMMKTEKVKSLRYDKAWEKCEDYDLWERAARAGWIMTNVPELLLHYRQHDSQISNEASSKQQELTQKIRRRYWNFMFESMTLKKEWIDEVLKLRDPLSPKPNMHDINLAFEALLEQNRGEARTVIFEHATKLYFRAAAICPDVPYWWFNLNRKFGVGLGLGMVFNLFLLSIFKLKPNSKLFLQLKKFYY